MEKRRLKRQKREVRVECSVEEEREEEKSLPDLNAKVLIHF